MSTRSSVIDALRLSAEPSVRWRLPVDVLKEDPTSRAIRDLQGEIRQSPRTHKLHYPAYWHYDLLAALTAMADARP